MPVNKKTKKLKEELVLNNLTNRDTAFYPLKGERGQVVYSTEPKFLFCDLKLKRNESQIFYFNDQLPDNSPPSYNGQAVKYFYKITIGIQRVNSSIQLLRMPLKVYNLPLFEDSAEQLNQSQNSSLASDSEVFKDAEKDKISNLQMTNQKQNEIISLILHKLDCLSSKRTMSSFIITNNLGKVGKFCLFKSIFKLGEDII
jgi:hypothetical protein